MAREHMATTKALLDETARLLSNLKQKMFTLPANIQILSAKCEYLRFKYFYASRTRVSQECYGLLEQAIKVFKTYKLRELMVKSRLVGLRCKLNSVEEGAIEYFAAGMKDVQEIREMLHKSIKLGKQFEVKLVKCEKEIHRIF